MMNLKGHSAHALTNPLRNQNKMKIIQLQRFREQLFKTNLDGIEKDEDTRSMADEVAIAQ